MAQSILKISFVLVLVGYVVQHKYVMNTFVANEYHWYMRIGLPTTCSTVLHNEINFSSILSSYIVSALLALLERSSLHSIVTN